MEAKIDGPNSGNDRGRQKSTDQTAGMIEKVGGRSKSTGQTAGMIGKVRGKVKIDGPNSGNDRE